MLVSVAEAKSRLAYDDSAHDFNVEAAIKGASAAVLNYCRPADPDWLDTSGDPLEDSDGVAIDIPDDVVTATLMLAGIFLRDPSGKDMTGWEHGFLPVPVLSILTFYRLPTLA